MLRVYPLRGEEDAAFRMNNEVGDDTVVFCADDGREVTYPCLRISGGDVVLCRLTGDEVMDEMFIRAAASYGEYRAHERLVLEAECSVQLLTRMGFADEEGEFCLPISRIIHYDN